MQLIYEVFSLYNERFQFFLLLIVQHFLLSVISIGLAAFFGVLIGIVMTRVPVIAKPLLHLSNFVYTIPSIAMFGILVTITGIGDRSAIIALVLYGLMPIIRNTYVGINDIDPLIIESAEAMGTTPLQLLFKVELPLAMPVIFAGFRTMTVMTIALTAIASFIGAGGLGVAIWRGISTDYTAMTLAGSLLVAFIAIMADLLLGFIEHRLQKRFTPVAQSH